MMMMTLIQTTMTSECMFYTPQVATSPLQSDSYTLCRLAQGVAPLLAYAAEPKPVGGFAGRGVRGHASLCP